MTKKEVKSMTTDEIILGIFSMGIMMSNARQTKNMDAELKMYCMELEERNIVEDGESLYIRTCE